MKKGQALMEFLMVYGWGLLILLSAIGGLWYVGAFNPDNWDKLPKEQTNNSTLSREAEICFTGCLAGLQWNGTDFNEINTTVSLEEYQETIQPLLNACTSFCEQYLGDEAYE